MKRIIFTALLAVSATAMYARGGVYDTGYRGNVGIQTLEIMQKGFTGSLIQVETVHGYSFGNGGFIGAGLGIGFYYQGSEYGMSTTLPVFIDGKYNFLQKNNVSPFAGFRTGFRAGLSSESSYTFISPSAGVDIGRFTFRFGYELGNGNAESLDNVDVTIHDRLHYLYMGFSFNF